MVRTFTQFACACVVIASTATAWASPSAADAAPDVVAPVTSITVESGTPSAYGWYPSWPLLKIVADDDASGVKEIHTWQSGGLPLLMPPPMFDPPVASYSTVVGVQGDGIHTIHYYAVDGAGNIEPTHDLVVRVDITPPAVVQIGWGGGAGPTSSSPSVNWTADSFVDVHVGCIDSLYDTGSGCDASASTVTIDGINRGVAPPTVSTEGRHSAIGSAQDFAGNASTSAPIILAVDHSAPIASVAKITATAHDVAMQTQAFDPVLADGTEGSGLLWVWFDATNVVTGESHRYLASAPSTGSTWIAHTDLPNGAYSIRATATDSVSHQTVSAPITFAVVRAAV